MFALLLGYSILRDIMHSLSLSAALERKNIHTGIKKQNMSCVTPIFPLDYLSSNSAFSTQSLPLPFYPKCLKHYPTKKDIFAIP